MIWNTLLYVGRTKKQHAMFVTGEEKSDWWHRSSGVSLYPRYELLDEYRAASEGHTFHIMSFAELLKHFGAKEAVVEEVRREQIMIHDEVAAVLVSPRRLVAEEAVRNWLIGLFGGVTETGSFPHFWADTPDGPMAVEVRLIGIRRKLLPKLEMVISSAREVTLKENARMMVVFVASRREDAVWAAPVFIKRLDALPAPPRRFEVMVGYLQGQAFHELAGIRSSRNP